MPLAQTLSELTGPVFGHDAIGPLDDDPARNGAVNGEPLGERIIVAGRVLDEAGRRATLVAERRETPDGIVYRFDTRLQGEAETVFFDA